MSLHPLDLYPDLVVARPLTPTERDAIDLCGYSRIRDQLDPERDLMLGGIALLNVDTDDKCDEVRRYVGHGGKIVYLLTIDARADGDLRVSADLLPLTARSRNEPESLYDYRLAAAPEGRALLELFDRVPGAHALLLAELTRIEQLQVSAAKAAILAHRAGQVPEIGSQIVAYSLAVRYLLDHPAYPVEQIVKTERPIAWSMWSADAAGGRFYFYGQGITSAYLCFVGEDDHAVVPQDRLSPAVIEGAEELYYRPVDADEAAWLHGLLRSSALAPTELRSERAARRLELWAR